MKRTGKSRRASRVLVSKTTSIEGLYIVKVWKVLSIAKENHGKGSPLAGGSIGGE